MADETADHAKASTPVGARTDAHSPEGPSASPDSPIEAAPTTLDHPAADTPSKPSPPDKPVAFGPARPVASEWTASDSRGPLECADEGGAASVATEDATTGSDAGGSASAMPARPEAASSTATDRADPPRVDPDVTPAPTKRSALPIAAGLVIGALIGAGSAAIVYQSYGAGGTDESRLAALQARVDALAHQSNGGDVAGLKTTVADLDGKVAALAKAGAGGGGQPADLGPVEQKIAALQSGLDALKAQSGGGREVQDKVAALTAEVADAKKQSAAAQAALTDVEGQQKALAGKAMAPAVAVVADSLVQQIDHGQPYVAQVDALAALGVDPAKIATLRQNAESGVPSAKTLAAKFEPLAEPIAATAHQPPANAGFVDKLKSGMYGLVSVRSVDDTSGTDLPSRVARIKADLAHDDVADALATWNALPADAKAKGSAWAAAAKTQVEAMATARGLQQDAIVALGAKKS